MDPNDPNDRWFLDKLVETIRGYTDKSHADVASRVDVVFDLLGALEKRFDALKREVEQMKQ
jgi:hypothetical protein